MSGNPWKIEAKTHFEGKGVGAAGLLGVCLSFLAAGVNFGVQRCV